MRSVATLWSLERKEEDVTLCFFSSSVVPKSAALYWSHVSRALSERAMPLAVASALSSAVRMQFIFDRRPTKLRMGAPLLSSFILSRTFLFTRLKHLWPTG